MMTKNKKQLVVDPLKKWRLWRFKNTAMLIASLFLFFYLSETSVVKTFLEQAGTLGYLGAFMTGIFFVSTFTAVPAAYVLFNLADNLHPVEVALLAGFGAMVGDYILFQVMKDTVFDELKPILGKLRHPAMRQLFATPYFAWLLPVLGAFMIASPLPDELGVSMLGLSKIKKWQFFVVTYILNAIGIFLVVTAARV